MKTEARLRVLVVGAGSMLAGALLALPRQRGLALAGVSHRDFAGVDLRAYDAVINMALDPRYMREAYDPALDFDLKVAEAAAKAACHFFMMSSRKVYGPARQWPLREDASKAPVEFYGRNKLETERRVEALLASNCTILRLANVFAFEPDRSTFFGIALRTLRREGCIILDSNPLVKKDFIPLTDCIDTIAAILPQMPAGIFNLGYGTATEIGQVARWLIEGYGRGELVVTSEEMRDEFLLDTEKLARLAGTPRERKSIQAHCLEIGEQLRHA